MYITGQLDEIYNFDLAQQVEVRLTSDIPVKEGSFTSHTFDLIAYMSRKNSLEMIHEKLFKRNTPHHLKGWHVHTGSGINMIGILQHSIRMGVHFFREYRLESTGEVSHIPPLPTKELYPDETEFKRQGEIYQTARRNVMPTFILEAKLVGSKFHQLGEKYDVDKPDKMKGLVAEAGYKDKVVTLTPVSVTMVRNLEQQMGYKFFPSADTIFQLIRQKNPDLLDEAKFPLAPTLAANINGLFPKQSKKAKDPQYRSRVGRDKNSFTKVKK